MNLNLSRKPDKSMKLWSLKLTRAFSIAFKLELRWKALHVF